MHSTWEQQPTTCQWAAATGSAGHCQRPVTELILGQVLWAAQPEAAKCWQPEWRLCKDGPALASPLAEGNGAPMAVSGIGQCQDSHVTTCESYDDRIERRIIGLRAVHHV